MGHRFSLRVVNADAASASFNAFLTQSTWAKRASDPTIADFVFGNPQEMPIPQFGELLARWSIPQHKDWFAYTRSVRRAQEVVADSLRARFDVGFESDDISMTTGNFAGTSAVLQLIAEPGDQVIFISPPWFFYEPLIVGVGAEAVRVKTTPSFDLDLEAIASHITPRTRGIIVNTPNNPTGRIYSEQQLTALAELLETKSRAIGRPIYLISDEAYNKIVFSDSKFTTPTKYYRYSFLLYTYGKTLLAPGERLGYIALPPTMPDRESVRKALSSAQVITGRSYPNVVLQYALPELEKLSIDLRTLERKRESVVDALRGYGYDVTKPEGTFYVVVRSPWATDLEFCEYLASQDVFVLPGSIVELPGYFRLSLTASEGMIRKALPVFERARVASR